MDSYFTWYIIHIFELATLCLYCYVEEAENERMHLLVCLKMFETSAVTRTLVVAAQLVMTPILMSIYLVHPKSMHRFVGYLEETACHTYASIIQHVETPGTHLHESWHNLPAPDIAKGYWKLDKDAKFVEALKCMVIRTIYFSTTFSSYVPIVCRRNPSPRREPYFCFHEM
jgi:hypothetical protein